MSRIIDISGQTIGSWKLIRFSHSKQYTHKKRNFWLVECINCKIQKNMEKHNLLPPSGGKCQHCWGRPKGYSGFLVLLDSYIRNAKQRKRNFTLTNEEFRDITSSACHYCKSIPQLIRRGGKSNNTKSHWGDYCYNGIDRVNNEIGYIKSNCISCCMICNRAKNKMSYNDFMCYINRIKLIKD